MNQQSRVAIAEDTLKLLDQEFHVNDAGNRVDLGPHMRYAINNTIPYSAAIVEKQGNHH